MLVLEIPVPPLPLIATVGHTLWPPGIVHARRQFDAFDIIICVKGTLYMEENGIPYDIKEGMVLVLEPEKMHRGYQPTDTETEVYWIHFQYPGFPQPALIDKTNWQQPLLNRTDQDIEVHPGMVDIPKFTTIDLRQILPLLTEMIHVHSMLSATRSYELQILFGRFLLELQYSMRNRSPQARSLSLGEQVATYLTEHLEQPFDATEMENDLHYHFDYLARCLKQYSGMSPLQYRHHLQIERAKQLLAHSELSIIQIGTRCGFNDNNYFTRLFKRHTSFTPGEFRKRYQFIVLD
ncbi:AraC family transcriptional regulator [Paenibacillus guangzhouensis]|uniref:AraC family transcriptional regulator n=1 Tax=Paenibacillus guangzhouensis TaxID=1473112 RepID=UPI001266E3CF|nr:AraC family transcriptional regulator [Paenibacillus guangzhouensis]